MQRRARLGLAVLAVVGIAGCGTVTTSAEAPLPTGRSPSEIARMVCTTKAAGEIAQVVGAKASVTAPTWADHLYSCGYQYSEGTVVLSVKELSSWTQTYAYFGKLAETLHKTAPVQGTRPGCFRGARRIGRGP